MTVSGPSPHRRQGPIDPQHLHRPLHTASALLQSAIEQQDAASLTSRVSFPYATEQSGKVAMLQMKIQACIEQPPRVPIWLAILTLGILPGLRKWQHGQELAKLKGELDEAKKAQIEAVLKDPKGEEWLAAGSAPVDVQYSILYRFQALGLAQKTALLDALYKTATNLGTPKHSPSQRRWAEQVADLAKRLDAAQAVSPEELETALINPSRSAFTQKVDPKAWLEQTQTNSISLVLSNRFIQPADSRGGIWAGEEIKLVDATGQKPKSVSVEGADETERAHSAQEALSRMLPIKQYGPGPRLDESKVSDPDRAYTTDLTEKSNLLVSLVNSNSRAFVGNLSRALVEASNGSLDQAGDLQTAQTLTLLPGAAEIQVKGSFQLQSASRRVYSVTCSYTTNPKTTGSEADLRHRLEESSGRFELSVSEEHGRPQMPSDQLLAPPAAIEKASGIVLPEDIDWSAPLQNVSDLNLKDLNQKARSLAYEVYEHGGPHTAEGKRALLQLCYLCASALHDPENQNYQDQILDPLDAMRSVELRSLEDGYDPVSFVDAFEVIKESVGTNQSDLLPWIFGQGAPGSPVCDALRRAWLSKHPKHQSPQRR